MEYHEVLDYLYEKLPFYQRKGPIAYKADLVNTQALDKLFGYPHKQFKSVHVAGTNGKGSVSHMLASVFQSAGYKTGLYTSPHLKDFRERIRIDGKMIPESDVTDFVVRFLELNRKEELEPSFFELTVMMAFDFFAREKVDIAIVEVGLGGRLDSTNVIMPELSVITNISLDHTALLGDTLGKIALEKAGIIKKGIPVVIGESHPQTMPVFAGIAHENHAPILFADQMFTCGIPRLTMNYQRLFSVKGNDGLDFPDIQLDLLGNYQSKNLCTVLSALLILRKFGWSIPEYSLRDGLSNTLVRTGFAGRWQTLGYNPLIICDTAHNEGGIREVVSQIGQMAYKRLHMVIGMVSDKDVASVLALLPKEATYYFTKASVERSMDSSQLKKIGAFFGLEGDHWVDVTSALTAAKAAAEKEDLIFVGGSTFVVADAL
ncbi:MAG: bifunctional folylpolyglutamate synthase/dihydrofolate synthase [Marinilabiliales bacterium]|nr:bifunctional folylpolyglutamate synthase/dihydrofolate synthase [Marinilabiliales bacterium]